MTRTRMPMSLECTKAVCGYAGSRVIIPKKQYNIYHD